MKRKLNRVSKLALNASKSHLAFGMDSGVVGVVDLSNNSITKMESKHDSVSGKKITIELNSIYQCFYRYVAQSNLFQTDLENLLAADMI